MKDKKYWFRHDADARTDDKLIEIQHIYGHWGKGIFWDVIEVLRSQKNYKYSSEESKLRFLCMQIFCDDFIKFKNWFGDCIRLELFKNEDGMFYSKSLSSRMRGWEKQKKNGSQKKRSQSGSQIASENEKNGQDKNKIRIREDKIKEEEYISFLSFLNQTIGKAYHARTKKYRVAFGARVKDGYTVAQMQEAVKNACADPFHIEQGLKYLTPEFILRPDKLDKFLNQPPAASKQRSFTANRDW